LERKGDIIWVTITRCYHQGLYLRDRLMHLKNEQDWRKVLSEGLKKFKPSPRGKIDSYPYLLSSIAWIIFTLAYLLCCICIFIKKRKLKASSLHHKT
jgi:hypothetical protein